MIRLAWRQLRIEAGVAMAALAVVAVVLAVTGPHLVHVFDTDRSQLAHTDGTLQTAVYMLTLVTPALLGVFFGTPLVARELETGTFRLAWTQGVSRARWLVVKLALAGVAASAVAGGLSLMVAWWGNPINIVAENRFSPGNFGVFGIVPFGYGLFAFALGATLGLMLRRTAPAIAATLAGYVGARYAATYWIRPRFEAPLRLSMSLTNPDAAFGFLRSPSRLSLTGFPPTVPNAWALTGSIVDKAGHGPTSQYLGRVCPTLLLGADGGRAGGPHTRVAPGGGIQACLARLASSFHEVVTYQPASRYWPFQIYETALFVAAALALGALSVWWLRRRLP